MTVEPPDTTRYDTRGLPEGYDPHKFYEYSYLKRVKNATGLEGFLYNWMPASLIQSFAFAIDPLSQLKMSLGVVTPANRLRFRQTDSVLNHRFRHHRSTSYQYASIVNYMGIGGNVGPVVNVSTNKLVDDEVPRYPQDPLPNFSNDTTRRTRLIGSDVGEFDSFKSTTICTGRFVKSTVYNYHEFNTNVPITPSHLPSIQYGITDDEYQYRPTAAAYPRADYDHLVSSEKDLITALMQNKALAMFKGINPQNRNYSLFRNIVELRDIPSSIASLKRSMELLIKLEASTIGKGDKYRSLRALGAVLKDVPNAYLSYHFGWKQTYNDVMDLMTSPSKITKQINLLIKRSGLPTTYRSTRTFLSGDNGVSAFDYDVSPLDGDWAVSSRIERTTELRMVINSTFQFPPADIPKLRYDLFTDKLGVYPRIIDIYNLVPWTWLVDYFTGFGNYLEIIENIHHDQSLINWGFLTGQTKGKVVSTFESRVRSTRDIYINYHGGDPHTTFELFEGQNHTSILEYKCSVRRDLATIMDVKCTSNPGLLSPYQESILGALLAQNFNFKRSRHTGG